MKYEIEKKYEIRNMEMFKLMGSDLMGSDL